MRRAADAKKHGKRIKVFDKEGKLVNPYIPMYISKAPCKRETCFMGVFIALICDRVHEGGGSGE